MTDEENRELDENFGEQDGPDPGVPEDVVEVETDWEEDDAE